MILHTLLFYVSFISDMYYDSGQFWESGDTTDRLHGVTFYLLLYSVKYTPYRNIFYIKNVDLNLVSSLVSRLIRSQSGPRAGLYFLANSYEL
jgi:hypothetical protein